MTEAFRTFAVDPPYAIRTLKQSLEKRVADLTAQMATGYAHDWADYCKRVGKIQGLTEAIEACEEFEKQEN